MELHQRAAARRQARAAGLCLAALDRHQDRRQAPRKQCTCPGTPRENQALGSAQDHYAHGAVPSMAVGLGAAVSAPRKGQLAGMMSRLVTEQGVVENGGRRREEADFGAKNTSASLPRRLRPLRRLFNCPGDRTIVCVWYGRDIAPRWRLFSSTS